MAISSPAKTPASIFSASVPSFSLAAAGPQKSKSLAAPLARPIDLLQVSPGRLLIAEYSRGTNFAAGISPARASAGNEGTAYEAVKLTMTVASVFSGSGTRMKIICDNRMQFPAGGDSHLFRLDAAGQELNDRTARRAGSRSDSLPARLPRRPVV